GTLTHAAATTINVGDATGGNLTLSSGMTYTVSNATTSLLEFEATTTGLTITTNNKSLPPLVFNGSGGSWTINDTSTTANTITVNTGATLHLNAQLTMSGTG